MTNRLRVAAVGIATTALASAAFFLVGPGLEAGVGPWLISGGFDRGAKKQLPQNLR